MKGIKTIGIYPLLSDNSTYLLTADFDKEGWFEATAAFATTCESLNISYLLERSNDSDDLDEANDLLAKINKTFKGVEIAGQIIRNRHATMTRDELYLLADSGISAGLRFLYYFIFGLSFLL